MVFPINRPRSLAAFAPQGTVRARPRSRIAALSAVAALTGCAELPAPTAPPPVAPAAASYVSPTYGRPDMWLCRPDLPGDRCRVDLSATEIHPDGSRTVVAHTPAKDPAVDCFYVYPTVDLRLAPGNHTDFTDVVPMAAAAVAQAARFSEVCRVYAPLYRQVTLGSYSFGTPEARLAVAFSDVADAFAHYLAQHNHGRPIALIGHSQGGDMVVRLLQRFFENDPALRAQLLVALPIGWKVEVPRGRTTGSTFATIPTCSTPDERGCVVTFRSHRSGSDAGGGRLAPVHAGDEIACVNPASVGKNERARLSRTYFPVYGEARKLVHLDGEVTTPFVLYRGFYAAQCQVGEEGYRYLGVWEARAPGDVRPSPIDLDAFLLNTSLGLHVFDMALAQGDLVEIVARRAAAIK